MTAFALRIFLCAVAAAFGLGGLSSAHAARLALVIGNDSYRHVTPLRNARADATGMAAALRDAGFQVALTLDADERGLRAAIRDLKQRVTEGDDVVLFYAGHGLQVSSTNFLLPVDIRGQSEDQIRDEALPLQRLLDDMEERRARFTLVIVDACRDNPFRSSGRALGGRGLAPTVAATGQMVIYSAGSGQQALDRLDAQDRDRNGVFTRVFLREMRKPQPVDRVVRSVRDEVFRLARSVGHAQVPALYDQSLGDFYFLQSPRGASAVQEAVTARLQPLIVLAFDEAVPAGALSVRVAGADLARSGRFRVEQHPAAADGGVAESPDFAHWRRRQVDFLLTATSSINAQGHVALAVRLWDVASARQLMGQGLTTGAEAAALRALGHRLADLSHQTLTGRPGGFVNPAAKVTTAQGYYLLQVSDSDGAMPQVAVKSPAAIALPTWSSDHLQLAYASLENGRPQFYRQTVRTGERIALLDAAVASACAVETSALSSGGGLPDDWLRDDWTGTPACRQALSTSTSHSR